jgi:hypothetical protein
MQKGSFNSANFLYFQFLSPLVNNHKWLKSRMSAADEVDINNFIRSGMDIRRFSDQPWQDSSFNSRDSVLDGSTVVGDGNSPLIPYVVDESKTMTIMDKYLAFICFCIAEFCYGAAYSSMYLFFPAVASEKPFNIPDFWIGMIISMTGVGGIISAMFYQKVLSLGNRKQIYVSSNIIVVGPFPQAFFG